MRRLDLFGSAVRADFSAERSDLDFLVSFDELPPVDAYDVYFSLKEGLEGLFSRSVDLVVERAIRTSGHGSQPSGSRYSMSPDARTALCNPIGAGLLDRLVVEIEAI